MKEEELRIKELENRLKLITNFYEESKLIKRIKFYIKYYKERKKYANYRNSTNNDTNKNNTIHNNIINNTWYDEINKIFNDKEIKNG